MAEESTEVTSTDTSGQTTDTAAASNTTPAAAPAQSQGPDWNGLGTRYGGYDAVNRDMEYMGGLRQRYSDPSWAQKYDALFADQPQQQAHPYDWMVGDDKRAEALRQQGDQHPDFARLQAEFTNFFQNPIGQLSQLVNHPKVVEAVYKAMQPQMQDLMNRSLQPMQQFMHRQGEAQFRQQYEKAWMALPDNIKQMAQEGIFGDWTNNRQQAIMGAVKAGQRFAPPAAPAADGQPSPTTPSQTNGKPQGKPDQKPAAASSGPKKKGAEDFEKDYAKALKG